MNNHEIYVYRTVSQRTPVIDMDEEGNVIEADHSQIVDCFDTFLVCEECERAGKNLLKVHDISEDWSAY